MNTGGRVATGMAVVLGAFAAVVAVFCVVFAIDPSGRELSGDLVGLGIVAAGFTSWALAKLRDVARTDAGWGGALVLYAVADLTLLLFFFALVLDHQLS